MQYGIATVSEKGLLKSLGQLIGLSKWNKVTFYMRKFYINGVKMSDIIMEIGSNGIKYHNLEEYRKGRDIVIHKNTPKISAGRALGFISNNKENISWSCTEFIENIFKDQGVRLFEGKKLTPGQINKKLSSKEDIIIHSK